MPATYEPIATTTLGTAAASITFSYSCNLYRFKSNLDSKSKHHICVSLCDLQ
jgi:hypothetical protein